MSKEFVWTCDYCLHAAKGEAELIPIGFTEVTCHVKSRSKKGNFSVTICDSCWEKSVDPSPPGMMRRLLSRFKGLRTMG